MTKRWEHVLLIAFFLGVIAVLSIGGLVRSDRKTSALEQRDLAQAPSATWPDLVSGEFGSKVETYLSDQFFARDSWVHYHALFSIRVLGKVVMNGTAIGKHGVLFNDVSGHKALTDAQIGSRLATTTSQLADLDRIVRSYGGTLLVVGLPSKNSFMRADLPPGVVFPSDVDRVTARFYPALDRLGIANVNMAPIFEQHRSEKLYYLTDHHWTFDGAYLAYGAMLEKLGLAPERPNDLNVVTLPNPFLGSFNKKLGLTFPENERLREATPRVPIPFTRYQNGVISPNLFTPVPAGGEAVHAVYDQGEKAEIVIDTHRPKLPSLLLFGDSYTDVVETLAWSSFDQSRYLDLRYFAKMSLFAYVEKYKPDYVVTIMREEHFLDRGGNNDFSGTAPSTGAEE